MMWRSAAVIVDATQVTDTIGDQVFETPDPQASAINAGNQLIAIADFRPLPAFLRDRPTIAARLPNLPDNAGGS
jgi:hypothetical protein